MTTPVRILLADDHELFREGLAGLINAQPDLEVVGKSGDGLEALTQVRDLKPDLIIMDISMPVCDGLEATRLILESFPKARILMLTVHEEDEKLFEAVKAGACGYLLKSIHSEEFLNAVRSTLKGEAPLPSKLAARLLEEFARLAQQPTLSDQITRSNVLTPREQQVLALIADGLSDKEVAHQLTVSLHTVKSHVRNILGKLKASNRHHAARIAEEKGWINGNQSK